MKCRFSCFLIMLLSLLMIGVSCQYAPYRVPDAGEPIEAIADPNEDISRELDGENYLKTETGDGLVTESCTYDFRNTPGKKIMKTFTVDGDVKFRTFTTETSFNYPLGSSTYGATRIATTNELTGKLVALSYEDHYKQKSMGANRPFPEFVENLIPKIELDGVKLVDFMKKTPDCGQRSLIIGNERSAWSASVEYMPQEIAAFMENSGMKDLDESDGPDGMKYYRYDLGNDIHLVLTRFERWDIIVDQDDMTTVSIEMPTALALKELLPLYKPY